MSLWSFQGARAFDAPHREKPARRPVSQNSAAIVYSRSTLFLGELDNRTERFSINGSSAHRVIAPVFPRKEVIQPQLPLRLPCYDFTPVPNPTFGGSLPCGLGHRLRVLPASVV